MTRLPIPLPPIPRPSQSVPSASAHSIFTRLSFLERPVLCRDQADQEWKPEYITSSALALLTTWDGTFSWPGGLDRAEPDRTEEDVFWKKTTCTIPSLAVPSVITGSKRTCCYEVMAETFGQVIYYPGIQFISIYKIFRIHILKPTREGIFCKLINDSDKTVLSGRTSTFHFENIVKLFCWPRLSNAFFKSCLHIFDMSSRFDLYIAIHQPNLSTAIFLNVFVLLILLACKIRSEN